MKKSDHKLGMGRDISRRDFIHDAGLAALGLGLPGLGFAGESKTSAPGQAAGYYPPVKTGLRGSHPGAFEAAHALALQGKKWDRAAQRDDTIYDLVVVGGGISGLSAAYFYRQQHGAGARILILDNHDDFGGHAKRNEFHQGGVMRLGFGGSINLEYTGYSKETTGLLNELGIDFEALGKASPYALTEAAGLPGSIYFDADHYGRDVLVPGASLRGLDPAAVLEFIGKFPLSDDARNSLRRFYASDKDLLAGKSREERAAFLRDTGYHDFLVNAAGLTAAAAQIFMNASHGWFGVTTRNLSIREAFSIELPGAHLLGDLPGRVTTLYEDKSAMFPDGNASVARLLVRSLIPRVAEGAGMEDILTTKFDYSQLDQPDSNIRLRLNSTAVNARNLRQGGVQLSYVNDNRAFRVRAKNCVMACYNAMIPHLCPELPEPQKQALKNSSKHPMLASNVLVKNIRAAENLGISSAYCPGRLHAEMWLQNPISLGKYRHEWDPGQPMLVHFFGSSTPGISGLDGRQANRAGQQRLLEISFEEIESELRSTLAGVFGQCGFNASEDVLAITVNRWPHGYAYEHLDLYDSEWPQGGAPHEIGRQKFGNITVANSDAAAYAYLDGAVDQAWRAVNELPG